ncbi:MAG: hypothetical protein WA231_09550 [Methylocella sp.]
MSKSIDGFFDGRSDEEIERIKDTLKTAFPPPDASGDNPPKQPGNTTSFGKIIDAEDILGVAQHCIDCVFLAATGLGDETDPIQAVTLIASKKIDEALALLGEYRNGSPALLKALADVTAKAAAGKKY